MNRLLLLALLPLLVSASPRPKGVAPHQCNPYGTCTACKDCSRCHYCSGKDNTAECSVKRALREAKEKAAQ